LGSRKLPFVELSAEEPATAGALVVVRDHDAIDYELIESHARYVFDTRSRLRGPIIERL